MALAPCRAALVLWLPPAPAAVVESGQVPAALPLAASQEEEPDVSKDDPNTWHNQAVESLDPKPVWQGKCCMGQGPRARYCTCRRPRLLHARMHLLLRKHSAITISMRCNPLCTYSCTTRLPIEHLLLSDADDYLARNMMCTLQSAGPVRAMRAAAPMQTMRAPAAMPPPMCAAMPMGAAAASGAGIGFKTGGWAVGWAVGWQLSRQGGSRGVDSARGGAAIEGKCPAQGAVLCWESSAAQPCLRR